MYLETFLIIIITLILIFYYYNDNRIEVLSDDGVKYKVRKSNNNMMRQKANLLSKINKNAKKLIHSMSQNNVPTQQIAKKTYARSKKLVIHECPDGSAGYTINKGISMCICCEKNNVCNSFEDAFFVVLHELAHVMSDEYGHGEEFKNNFDIIIKYAVKIGLYIPKDYAKNNVEYCGVKITTSPCDGDQCTKSNLDYYFKESLLQY